MSGVGKLNKTAVWWVTSATASSWSLVHGDSALSQCSSSSLRSGSSKAAEGSTSHSRIRYRSEAFPEQTFRPMLAGLKEAVSCRPHERIRQPGRQARSVICSRKEQFLRGDA